MSDTEVVLDFCDRMTYSEKYFDYGEREELKKIGWEGISATDEPRKKAWYFLHYIIKSHYWRERESIESAKNRIAILRAIRGKKYYKHYILDIDHYTCHWLWANKKLLPEGVLEAIKEDWHYEPEENKFMREGHTNYYIPIKRKNEI